MPVEQAIVAALAAINTPDAFAEMRMPAPIAAQDHNIDFEPRRLTSYGPSLAISKKRVSFSLEGPRRSADSFGARIFERETRNLSRTFRGAPRPAFASIRLQIAL